MQAFKNLALSCLLASALTPAVAATSFTIQAIQIKGNQRIDQATILNYLPVHAGQSFDPANADVIIHALYDTGFFSDIKVDRSGNSLIIQVVERPTIGSINISGNKDIDKDRMDTVVKDLGLVTGHTFEPAVLEKVKLGLQSEYYNRGRYNARVTTSVNPESRNRVAINITISEGLIVKVAKINIIGSQAFSEKQLLKDLSLAQSNWLSVFTRDDQYSPIKLEQTLDDLKTYYLNRGYLKFKIDSAQAMLTPDRNDIDISIRVSEGDKYTIKAYKVTGRPLLSSAELDKLINIKTGAAFSRQAITDANKAIADALGDKGYAFANINVVPELDEAKKQVTLIFFIEPGQRIYIRQMHYTGNTTTADTVLRSEARQLEASQFSTSQIEESKRHLKLLSYIQDVTVDTAAVPGSTNQIDLNYKVTEAPPAAAMASISYGTTGLGFGASLSNSNFMGTGKSVNVAFNTDPYVRTYSINYNNPYYTPDGVQRGFTLYSSRYTPGRVNITNYTYDTYGGSVNYAIPISAKDDSILLGVGFQNTRISIGNNPSQEIVDFTQQHGTEFNQLLLTTGWNRNSLDRALFPTQGLNQTANLQLSLPINNSTKLEYYKLNYSAHLYHPIKGPFILSLVGNIGYGNGYGSYQNLPFFQNYFAGGMGYPGAIRGFVNNSLGPLDSLGQPIGGNFMATTSAGIIFPNFAPADKLRTTWFVDAGNVYNTRTSNNFNQPSSGPIRISTGLGADWRIPQIGVFSFSLAKPLNAKAGDQKEFFQFNFGTSF